MKSIVYSQTGDPSVLHLVDRPLTEPGAGEVRVRIVVSGVNPTDWKSRRGSAPGQALAFDDVVPGQDGAGIVEAVGAGVEHVSVGDRVWLALAAYQRANSGSAQEHAVLPAERVFLLPANASFDQGASLGVPAITAYRALTVAEDGPQRLHPGALAGKVVLVAGGAGAVGHAAIQLARWAGASVVTTVSGPAKAALATAAGAQHVLTYTDPNIVEQIRAIAPEGVDLIVEVAPAQCAARPGGHPQSGVDRGLCQQRRRPGDARRAPALQPQRALSVRAALHGGCRRDSGGVRGHHRGPRRRRPGRWGRRPVCRCTASTSRTAVVRALVESSPVSQDARQTKMSGENGSKLDVVSITLGLASPIESSLYEYFAATATATATATAAAAAPVA